MDTKKNLGKSSISRKTKSFVDKKYNVGVISTKIWSTVGKRDSQYINERSISFERNYVDTKGNWCATSYLRIKDLPNLALSFKKAYDRLSLHAPRTTA